MTKAARKAMLFVKREYPGAWWNRDVRAIEGASHGLRLGHGFTEDEAWIDAAKTERRKRK